MSLIFALRDWKAGEAAKISGVSPELQRQWRRLGVLTPLNDAKKTKFNIITISFVAAARALIDAGAGHKKIDRLINHLGGHIMHAAILRGELAARAPVSREDVQDQILKWGAPALSARMHQKYFAFRNDKAAVGSQHRGITFNHFKTFEEWLQTGVEKSEFSDERDVFTGRKIKVPALTPDEIAEDEEWARQHPPEPALPPAASAVVLDIEAIAEKLLDGLGRVYGEIWDDELDVGTAEFRSLSARARDTAARLDDILDSLSVERERLVAERDAILDKRTSAASPEALTAADAHMASVDARLEQYWQNHDELWPEVQRLKAEHEGLVSALEGEFQKTRLSLDGDMTRYRVDTFDLGLRPIELKDRARLARRLRAPPRQTGGNDVLT